MFFFCNEISGIYFPSFFVFSRNLLLPAMGNLEFVQ